MIDTTKLAACARKLGLIDYGAFANLFPMLAPAVPATRTILAAPQILELLMPGNLAIIPPPSSKGSENVDRN